MELKLPKSFVDVLFIMLLGAVVLLAESVRMQAVDTAPVEVGGGGISPVRADEVGTIVVGAQRVTLDGQEPGFEDLEPLLARLDATRFEAVVLMPADEAVGHHRVMSVWSTLIEAGHAVKLAAVSRPEPDELER